jgi:hypothetical protein
MVSPDSGVPLQTISRRGSLSDFKLRSVGMDS